MHGGSNGHHMPRWVRAFVVVGILVVLAAVVVFAFGGQHGPGRHFPAGNQSSGEDSSGGHGGASSVAQGALRINVTADGFAFEPSALTIAVGTNVAIALSSVDVRHDFTVDELNGHVAADPGETAVGGFHAAPPGRYAFYCSESGHRDAGMVGTLVADGGADYP